MLVSIVITCHNYDKYLGRAIRSAINQNFPRDQFEILVVNDFSPDETKEVMDSFLGYIRPIHLEENVGLAAARNIGIKRALGKYVVHIDADDYVSENLILIESMYLDEHKDWGAVSCNYELIDEEGNFTEKKNGKVEPIACGIMFRKDKLFDIGLYNPEFKAMEEEELRRRFESKYKITNIDLSLYRYRRHSNNLTNDKEKMAHFSKKLDLIG
ncbi:MAG: glycosyltransferase [Deltaproteobacteria bacterium]|nr:glycosyltransferase [Deltaproteobacteria bacterium]